MRTTGQRLPADRKDRNQNSTHYRERTAAFGVDPPASDSRTTSKQGPIPLRPTRAAQRTFSRPGSVGRFGQLDRFGQLERPGPLGRLGQLGPFRRVRPGRKLRPREAEPVSIARTATPSIGLLPVATPITVTNLLTIPTAVPVINLLTVPGISLLTVPPIGVPTGFDGPSCATEQLVQTQVDQSPVS